MKVLGCSPGLPHGYGLGENHCEDNLFCPMAHPWAGAWVPVTMPTPTLTPSERAQYRITDTAPTCPNLPPAASARP